MSAESNPVQPEQLHTRSEWKKLGITIALNTKPCKTEPRDGKLTALFRKDQGKPSVMPGEVCNWSFELQCPPRHFTAIAATKRRPEAVTLPTDQLAWILEQFDLADDYALRLRKVELERRRDSDDLLRRLFPEYQALMLQIDTAERTFRELIAAVRAENARARRRVDTDTLKEAITAARKVRAALYTQRGIVVTPLFRSDEYKEASERLETVARDGEESAREAARTAGLGWGTCQSVENGAAKLRTGPPPNLNRQNAESLYVQMQAQSDKAPLTWERMLSGRDTRIRARLDGKCAVVSVRLGGERLTGEWVECRFVMSRFINGERKPFPGPPNLTDANDPDAVARRERRDRIRGFPVGTVVKGVRICRRRIGYRDVWSIVFSLERRGGFPSLPRADSGKAAVDVGYRKLAHGVRVAYWVGSDGDHGEVIIPEGRGDGLPPQVHQQNELPDFAHVGTGNAVGYYMYPRHLQKIRDEAFDQMILELSHWCDIEKDALPDWLREEATVFHQIRSKERMLGLLEHWRNGNRFEGDAIGHDILDRWREWRDEQGHTHGELHLAAWEGEQRVKFSRWRKDYYRRFWSALRRRYAVVVFEDMLLSNLRNGNPDPDEEGTPGDDYANLASLYQFRELGGYKPVRQRHDPSTEYVKAENSTRECWKCHKICHFDQAAELVRTCEHCGSVDDQDYCAGKNLLDWSNE